MPRSSTLTNPEQRIDVAAKRILSSLLLEMQRNETGMREDRDVECLHDFRVALRRTRTLLHQLNGIFPQPTIRRFKREFYWLRNATGPARDLDVYLLSKDQYTSYLPDKRQQDLVLLFDYLGQRRQAEHLAVKKVLGSARYRKIMDDWKKNINKPPARQTRLIRANTPVIVVANQSIWRAYRKVLKKGRRIYSGSPASALHKLRKECKNLRYLIEFFRGVYADEKIQQLLDNLKNLQNNLGEFQDLEMQQYFPCEFIASMAEQSDIRARTCISMQMLNNKLKQCGLKVRNKFTLRFSKFNSAENHRIYRKLFKD